jgi:hypothetical protein
VLLDRRNVALQCRIQRDALRTKDQLVQVLAVSSFDLNSGTDVGSYKRIVEYRDARQWLPPRAVLIDDLRSTDGQNDMWAIGGTKAVSVLDERRVASA